MFRNNNFPQIQKSSVRWQQRPSRLPRVDLNLMMNTNFLPLRTSQIESLRTVVTKWVKDKQTKKYIKTNKTKPNKVHT